jgi:hypothetical protein
LRAAPGARYQHGMTHQEIPRDELHATLRARGEVDSELEPHLVDSFLDRIERSIDTRADARIEARLRAHGALRSPQQERNSGPAASTVVLALGSIGCGIGATGAASALGDVTGFLVAVTAWLSIAAINIAHALRR